MPETRQIFESLKFLEIFSVISEFDGNHIFSNTSVSSGNQNILFILHISRVTNSSDLISWTEIEELL